MNRPAKWIQSLALFVLVMHHWACSPYLHTAQQPMIPLVAEKTDLIAQVHGGNGGAGAGAQYSPTSSLILIAQLEGQNLKYSSSGLTSNINLWRSTYSADLGAFFIPTRSKNFCLPFGFGLGAGNTLQTELLLEPASKFTGRNYQIFVQPGFMFYGKVVQYYGGIRINRTIYPKPELNQLPIEKIEFQWLQLTNQLTFRVAQKFYIGTYGTVSAGSETLTGYQTLFPMLNIGLKAGVNFNKERTIAKTDD